MISRGQLFSVLIGSVAHQDDIQTRLEAVGGTVTESWRMVRQSGFERKGDCQWQPGARWVIQPAMVHAAHRSVNLPRLLTLLGVRVAERDEVNLHVDIPANLPAPAVEFATVSGATLLTVSDPNGNDPHVVRRVVEQVEVQNRGAVAGWLAQLGYRHCWARETRRLDMMLGDEIGLYLSRARTRGRELLWAELFAATRDRIVNLLPHLNYQLGQDTSIMTVADFLVSQRLDPNNLRYDG